MARPALSQNSPLIRFPWWPPQLPPQLAKPSPWLVESQGEAFLRGCLSSPPPEFRFGKLEQLGRFDFQHGGELTDDLQTGIERALFELAQVAPANFGLICEVVLRKLFRMTQSAQISGKHFPQVHAVSEPTCSKCTPRYTEQNGPFSRRNEMTNQSLAVGSIAIALLIVLTGCARWSRVSEQAAEQRNNPTQHQTGWKNMDGTPADGAPVQQAGLICNEAATRAMNPGTTAMVQFMTADATLKSCMAKSGYLPVYEIR